MGQIPARYSTDAKNEFHQQLSRCDISQLQLIFEYFKNDFIIIVQSLRTEDLEKLASQKIFTEQIDLQMKKDPGPFSFSTKLVEDVLDSGKEAIVGFLESLHELHMDSWLPSMSRLIDEFNYLGDALLQQILLDRNGHPLNTELKALQEHHKHHLLETIQTEYKTQEPPRENQHIWISERYMDLIVTHVRPLHRQDQHRLIETGIKHEEYLQTTQNYPDIISSNRLFRWCHLLKRTPHAVMVSGVSGIGKTTMLQKFIGDWAKGKFYQRFAFIFYFQFQDLNKLGSISLQSMILQQYPYLESQLEDILKDPSMLLFIFDGFDECVDKVDFKAKQLCRNIRDAESVGTIVVSLVKQSLLKGCSMLLASRPDMLAVTDMSIFRGVMEVIGFKPKERQLYCEKFFNNKELSDTACSLMEQNGVLSNFCYLPSFCWILCTVISTFFKAQRESQDQPELPLPKTLTQLFATFLANILSNQSWDEARKLLTSIGWLAEHGIMNHITRFEEQTLLRFDVDVTSKTLPSFMKESSNTPHAFSFRYPMIQEFLAALVHYIAYSPEKLQTTLEEARSYKDNRGEIFLCFLCGLSDISTRSILKPLLGDLSSNVAQDVLTWHQKSIADVKYLDSFEVEHRKLLNVFFRLFETQNKDFVLECLEPHKRFNVSAIHLTPLECTVLTFMMESCRENEELCLSNCKLQSASMIKFAPALHTLHTLSLCENRSMGDDGVQSICLALTHPECRIHALWLALNGLTHRACSYLGSAMRNNQSLRILSLAYNKVEGPHFSDLMAALSDPFCKLEDLYLSNAYLTESSFPHLASGIRGNQSLKKLDLSFNYLSGPHFVDLMSALSSPTCKVEQLWLEGIQLRNEHLPSLVVLSHNTHLTHLQLSHNDDITDAGINDIKELLLKSPSLKHIRQGSSLGDPASRRPSDSSIRSAPDPLPIPSFPDSPDLRRIILLPDRSGLLPLGCSLI